MSKEVIAELNGLIWKHSLSQYGKPEIDSFKKELQHLTIDQIKKELIKIRGNLGDAGPPARRPTLPGRLSTHAELLDYLAVSKIRGDFLVEPEIRVTEPSFKEIHDFFKDKGLKFNDTLQEQFSHSNSTCIRHLGRQTNLSEDAQHVRILFGGLKMDPPMGIYLHPLYLCMLLNVSDASIDKNSHLACARIQDKVKEKSLKLMKLVLQHIDLNHACNIFPIHNIICKANKVCPQWNDRTRYPDKGFHKYEVLTMKYIDELIEHGLDITMKFPPTLWETWYFVRQGNLPAGIAPILLKDPRSDDLNRMTGKVKRATEDESRLILQNVNLSSLMVDRLRNYIEEKHKLKINLKKLALAKSTHPRIGDDSLVRFLREQGILEGVSKHIKLQNPKSLKLQKALKLLALVQGNTRHYSRSPLAILEEQQIVEQIANAVHSRHPSRPKTLSRSTSAAKKSKSKSKSKSAAKKSKSKSEAKKSKSKSAAKKSKSKSSSSSSSSASSFSSWWDSDTDDKINQPD